MSKAERDGPEFTDMPIGVDGDHGAGGEEVAAKGTQHSDATPDSAEPRDAGTR